MLVWNVFLYLPECLLLPLVFAYIYISQGSVEVHLWCGGIYNNHIIANCLQSVQVGKFWNSVNNWRRYVHKYIWPTVYLWFVYLLIPYDIGSHKKSLFFCIPWQGWLPDPLKHSMCATTKSCFIIICLKTSSWWSVRISERKLGSTFLVCLFLLNIFCLLCLWCFNHIYSVHYRFLLNFTSGPWNEDELIRFWGWKWGRVNSYLFTHIYLWHAEAVEWAQHRENVQQHHDGWQ